MSKIKPSYQHLMTIVHGQSEYALCRCIKSNLHLPMEIVSRDKGKSSIQINSVMDVLKQKDLKTFSSFHRTYDKIETIKKLWLISKHYIKTNTKNHTYINFYHTNNPIPFLDVGKVVKNTASIGIKGVSSQRR